MEPLAEKLLTVYGPLGLGWIVAGYLFVRNGKIVDRYHDLVLEVAKRFEDSTSVQTEMKTIIQERLK